MHKVPSLSSTIFVQDKSSLLEELNHHAKEKRVNPFNKRLDGASSSNSVRFRDKPLKQPLVTITQNFLHPRERNERMKKLKLELIT
jgi:hypothetical protein